MMAKQSIKATVYDKRGRVLSVGVNSYVKTHPRQAELAAQLGTPQKQFLHAEVAALVRCRGTPYRISVERRDKKGKLMLAKPCPICERAIKEAGVKFIEYSV